MREHAQSSRNRASELVLGDGSGSGHHHPRSCPWGLPGLGHPLPDGVGLSAHGGRAHPVQVCVGEGTGSWQGGVRAPGPAHLLPCDMNTAQDVPTTPGSHRKQGRSSPPRSTASGRMSLLLDQLRPPGATHPKGVSNWGAGEGAPGTPGSTGHRRGRPRTALPRWARGRLEAPSRLGPRPPCLPAPPPSSLFSVLYLLFLFLTVQFTCTDTGMQSFHRQFYESRHLRERRPRNAPLPAPQKVPTGSRSAPPRPHLGDLCCVVSHHTPFAPRLFPHAPLSWTLTQTEPHGARPSGCSAPWVSPSVPIRRTTGCPYAPQDCPGACDRAWPSLCLHGQLRRWGRRMGAPSTHLWDNACFIILGGSEVSGSRRRLGLDLVKPAAWFPEPRCIRLGPSSLRQPRGSAPRLSPRSCRVAPQAQARGLWGTISLETRGCGGAEAPPQGPVVLEAATVGKAHTDSRQPTRSRVVLKGEP